MGGAISHDTVAGKQARISATSKESIFIPIQWYLEVSS